MTCTCGNHKYPYDEQCIDCKSGKLHPAVKGQLNQIKREIGRLMMIHPVPYNELEIQYTLYENIIKISIGEV